MSVIHRVQKKVVCFVFEQLRDYRLDFLTIFSDRY